MKGHLTFLCTITIAWLSACGLNPYLTSSCADGIDNDGDGLSDQDDPECARASQDSEIVCDNPQQLCDLYCIDPRTDRRHCGGCGTLCGIDQLCSDGQCTDSDGLSCQTAMPKDPVRVPSVELDSVESIEQDFQSCSSLRGSFASRYHQLAIQKNPAERMVVALNATTDQVLFFYSGCLPTPQLLGCLQVSPSTQRIRALLPEQPTRYSVIYLELQAETAAQLPAPDIEIW